VFLVGCWFRAGRNVRCLLGSRCTLNNFLLYFISIFVEHIRSFAQIYFFIDTDSSRHIIATYLLCVICFRTCGHASLIDFSLQKATLSKFANRHGDVRRHAPACVDLSHGSC